MTSRIGNQSREIGAHILVVDGDDAILRQSQSLLEQAGYAVTLADLPDIGLVRRVEPDAVVLGLMFRGQAAGIEFLERHAADPATAAIPVVVHAAAAELSAAQWRRLTALAPPIVPATQAADGLLTELQRVLATVPMA
jgi:CheY-like chemotaxis protein